MKLFNFKILLSVVFAVVSCTQQPTSNTATPKTDSILKIKTKFLEADTVFLVGHMGRANQGKSDSDTVPAIRISNKINYSIVKKLKPLNKIEIDTLLNILLRQGGEYIGPSKCGWNPHHAIILVKDQSCSYIDMCFMCEVLETSDDLRYLPLLSPDKWSELQTFFIAKGARYYESKTDSLVQQEIMDMQRVH